MTVPDTIALIFEPTLRVAGETIRGKVHLYFPGLIKDNLIEVYVKLRGSVYTRIATRRVDQPEQEQHLSIPLIYENISIWKRGFDSSSYPVPDSDLLVRPFSFTLPSTLLPSCEYDGLHTSTFNIHYFVQVVGQYQSRLKVKTRKSVPFPILPALSSGADIREALQQRWRGPWRSIVQEKNVRRGLWGEHSHVKMMLVIPELDAFPIFTSIPYTLTIITHSKPMKHDDNTTDESPFPAPPKEPHEISFWLESDVFLKTKSWTADRKDNFITHLGGLEPQRAHSKVSRAPVEVERLEKVWLPEDEKRKTGKGRWKQEVTFRSTLRLNCTPSFESETVNLLYRMKLRVDFPGMGNSLKANFPVHIVSSIRSPGERAWDGPPPELDLPPDYFNVSLCDEDSLEQQEGEKGL